MKIKNVFLLLVLLILAVILIAFSPLAREGAYQGLVLAENTIIPSLLPMLIIFLLIMKTGAKDVLAKGTGVVASVLFNLPEITAPAVFFGLVGGYPTGALLTAELLENEEIDNEQAERMLCFNFCGGCGFIITAVGTGVIGNIRAGLILFFSNIISSVMTGVALSFMHKRSGHTFYSYTTEIRLGDALNMATVSAVNSVLTLTAYIVLFCSFNNIISPSDFIKPVIEITSGICDGGSFTLPQISGYLAFGGLCVHIQLLPIIFKVGMRYYKFLLSRLSSAFLSYAVAELLCRIFPQQLSVFSNVVEQTPVLSSVNLSLSVLLVIGSVVLVLDISSRKRIA